MRIDYNAIIKSLPESKVPRPNKETAGTLSGHAAGEPFANYVCDTLKRTYQKCVYKQYEFLNSIYNAHHNCITYESRCSLISSPTVAYLLSRGREATNAWTPTSLFEEKQNDTADILFVDAESNYYDLIDVKSHKEKLSQPPNIISALKVANMCVKMISNNDFDVFDIHYIEVDWVEQGDVLCCKQARYANLFLEPPENLYINWAAALQIQFFVKNLKQNFSGSKQEWVKAYLKHFHVSASHRCEYMYKKFVHPYEKYIQ